MATRRTFLQKPTYIYLNGADLEQRENNSSLTPSDTQFNFDESDVWENSNESTVPSQPNNPIPTSKKPARKIAAAAAVDRRVKPSSSLPVKIPDWSKILQSRGTAAEDCGVGDDDEDEDARIPPHEYLARTRMASFSVHEGIGRTLKGRDLSRVRNAIWKQTGFED